MAARQRTTGKGTDTPSHLAKVRVAGSNPVFRSRDQPDISPTSGLEEFERLGEFGARGVGWEPLDDCADSLAPFRWPPVGEPAQIVRRPQRKNQRTLRQPDLDG